MEAWKSWLWGCPNCRFLSSTLSPGAGAPIEGVEELRRRNFASLLDWVQRHRELKGARLLEVGCSTGTFLLEARSRGSEVRAIEPELKAVLRARELGFEVDHGFFPTDLSCEGPFDIVVFNDVFEHLPNPRESLAAARDLITKSGLFVLNLPSSNGVLYRTAEVLDRLGISGALERLWQRGLSSPHLSYFNGGNLHEFLTRNSDLEILEHGSLLTMSRSGLLARIQSTVSGPASWFVYGCLYLLVGLLEKMPSDIQFVIARPAGDGP